MPLDITICCEENTLTLVYRPVVKSKSSGPITPRLPTSWKKWRQEALACMLMKSVLLFAEIALRSLRKLPEVEIDGGNCLPYIDAFQNFDTHVSYLANPLLLGRNSKMHGNLTD